MAGTRFRHHAAGMNPNVRNSTENTDKGTMGMPPDVMRNHLHG